MKHLFVVLIFCIFESGNGKDNCSNDIDSKPNSNKQYYVNLWHQINIQANMHHGIINELQKHSYGCYNQHENDALFPNKMTKDENCNLQKTNVPIEL